MKGFWPQKPLGEIVTRLTNGYVGPTRNIYLESGVPYLLARHVRDNRLEFDGKTFISKDFNRKNMKSMLKVGDVLLVQSGHIGHSAVVTEEHEGHNCHAMIVITPVREAITGEFLSLYFNTPEMRQRFEEIRSGSTVPHLTCGAVRELMVPLPPLPEQRRIIGILDEAFDSIAAVKANAEKNLQNARALFESHLQAIFTQRGEGWVEQSLEELGTITSSKRIFKSEYVKSGVPFYRTKEIKELANGREITTELFISDIRYREIKASFGVPKKGDILLTAIGTIGEIYVVEEDDEFYFKDGNVLWLKDFASINPHFLKYALVSFVENLNKMAHGAAYSALPIQRLNAHKMFVPSLKEQCEIVSLLESLSTETRRLESIYLQKLAALDELKKSLLHQAFNGEL